MAREEDEEKDMEIPGEEDENVGEEAPKKKKENRRKTKEEKIAERKVIFWTMIIVIIITLGFWLVPKVGGILKGDTLNVPTEEKTDEKSAPTKNEPKNYVEITL